MGLTAKQLEELRQAIQARHAALLAEIRGDVDRARGESYIELAGPVTDPADQATADLLSDVSQAEVTRDLGEARDFEAAQARLADGSYGYCIDCGLEIAFERLRINPAAARCFDCQRMHEKTHAHAPEPRF